jgi:Lon protease-like protein
MPLNLHIFEERYKLMINECIDKRQPFGVVLISNNQPDTSQRVEPYAIGCTAHITQVQPLTQGRMNIAAIGKDRFHVVSLNHDKPYLSGMTEEFPLITQTEADTMTKVRTLKHHLRTYLESLQKARDTQFDMAYLPNDPTDLAYLSAVLLRVEPEQKQELLAIERLDDMIDSLLSIYRREAALISTLLSPPDNITFKGNFSLN